MLIVRFLGALGVAIGVNLIIDMLDNDEIRFGEPILIQHLLHLLVERSLVSELSDDSLLLARLFVGNGGSKILIQGGVIISLDFTIIILYIPYLRTFHTHKIFYGFGIVLQKIVVIHTLGIHVKNLCFRSDSLVVHKVRMLSAIAFICINV